MTGIKTESTNCSHMSILYVDDDRDHLMIYKHFLEQSGMFKVDMATSVEKALDLFQFHQYDAIVSDYLMPGVDGLTFLKIVREEYGDIPFIFITGKGREEIVIEAINSGADFYIQKNIDRKSQFEELANKILQAILKKRADKELIEREIWLRSVFEITHESFSLIDEEGKIIEWNTGSEKITGITKENAIGKYIWEITSQLIPFHNRTDLSQKNMEQAVRVSLITGVPPVKGPRIFEATRLDGARIFIKEFIFSIKTDKGYRFASIIEDVTSEKESERVLLESEERFRGIAERSSDLILIIEDGHIVYASPAARQVTGYEPEELIGKTKDFAATTVFPINGHEIMDHFLQVRKGEVVEDFNITITKKDGNTAFVNMYAVPTLRNGIITGAQVSMRDITKTKKIEIALQESEEKFRSLVTHADDLVYSLTPDEFFTYISPKVTDLLGYEISEVLGRPISTFMHPDDYNKNRDLFLRNLMIEENTLRYESRLLHKDGTWRWHVQSCSAIFDSQGTLKRVQGISQDITEQRKSADAIRKANRQLNLMSGITRHDILNKITVIYTVLTLAKMDYSDPKLQEFFGIMKKATEDIQNQIEFTRVYEDLGSQEPQWIPLDPLLPRSSVPEEVTMVTDVHNVSIFADSMVQKVFLNLLDNSIRHGQRVSEIRVFARESEKYLTVVWEDNGVGVMEEEKEKIFVRGFGKHTGFGMFLAREILSLTDISIRETGVFGQGARFEIDIPKGAYRVM